MLSKYVKTMYALLVTWYEYFFAKCRQPEPIPLDPKAAVILDDYITGLQEITALIHKEENRLNRKWKTQ